MHHPLGALVMLTPSGPGGSWREKNAGVDEVMVPLRPNGLLLGNTMILEFNLLWLFVVCPLSMYVAIMVDG